MDLSQSLRDQLLSKTNVNRSNFNLTHVVRNSCAPGVLYPIEHFEILPGDQISINVKSLMKSFATKAPLMGSFKCQYDFFYVPLSAYMPALRDNTRDIVQSSLKLPQFTISPYIGISSLNEYLYSSSVRPTGDLSINVQPVDNVNAVPFNMYNDICYNYYFNFNETNHYLINNKVGSPVGSPVPYYQAETNDTLGQWLATIKQSYSSEVSTSRYNVQSTNDNTPLGGLYLRTYLPDRNTVFLSEQNRNTFKIPVQTSSFDEFVTSSKLYNYLLRIGSSSGRYRDFIQSTFNVTPDILQNMPTHLGSSSFDLNFEGVVQTAPDNSTSPDKSYVGEQRGFGHSTGNSSKHTYNFKDHGYFMVMFSIVPRVDYFEGLNDYANKLTFGSLYNPLMDNIAMQPLTTVQLTNVPYKYKDSVPQYRYPSRSDSVGYQPCWTEYTSKLNQLHGDFQHTLRYWTLSRSYAASMQTPTSRPVNYSTYVFPSEYNYAFADVSSTAENFQLQSEFNITAKRPISQKQMPKF